MITCRLVGLIIQKSCEYHGDHYYANSGVPREVSSLKIHAYNTEDFLAKTFYEDLRRIKQIDIVPDPLIGQRL